MQTTNQSPKKYALAVWHSGGKGKTESVRQFAFELLRAFPTHTIIHAHPAPIPLTGDFTLIVQVNGRTVGIASQGDPGTGLKGRLELLVTADHCDLIVCTCRTRGETVDAVSNLRSRGFEIIWTSTYELNGAAQRTIANQAKGVHMLDLLTRLSIL